MTEQASEVDSEVVYRVDGETLKRLNLPPNAHIITKVVYPKEGGILSFFDRLDEPLRGFPLEEPIHMLDPLKQIVLAVFDALRGKGRRSDNFLINLALNATFRLDALFKKFYFPSERMSEPVRELYSAIKMISDRETDPNRSEFFERAGNLLCMFLELDTSYRWRFQWALERINMDKMKLSKEDKYWCRLKKDFRFEE